MPLVIGVLLAALGGCTGAKVNSRAGIPTIVVVTRHADTDPGSGVLNATERERAQALADLVAPMGVTGIYSPDLVAHPHDHAPRVPLQDLLGDAPAEKTLTEAFRVTWTPESRASGSTVARFRSCRGTCRRSTAGWAGTVWARWNTGIYIY